MIDIHVEKKQGDFRISAAFASGETGITALFGPSGAGKTSIINMVAGLLRPDKGHITIDGNCLFDSDNGINIPPEKRHIGYIFQEGRLFPHLSVLSNLTYGMRLIKPAKRFVKLDQVVELLGIENLLYRRPAKLSGGEKQRVAIGRALLTSPAILLMDEPLASLDETRKAEVLPFIIALTRNLSVPILYVSHDLEEIMTLADNVVLIEAGSAIATGSPEELIGRIEPKFPKFSFLK
ncbi:MAG: molybdenum ABC transporter ATP-binding protein [Proteobacteria bacterium]|nr:molybdenum ABC transporter ATP-binding protein [Pseudomonadota bacterium]